MCKRLVKRKLRSFLIGGFPVKRRNRIQKQSRKNLKLFLEFRALLLNENYSVYWSRGLVDHPLVTLFPTQLIPTAWWYACAGCVIIYYNRQCYIITLLEAGPRKQISLDRHAHVQNPGWLALSLLWGMCGGVCARSHGASPAVCTCGCWDVPPQPGRWGCLCGNSVSCSCKWWDLCLCMQWVMHRIPPPENISLPRHGL